MSAWRDEESVTVEIRDYAGRLVPAHADAGDPGLNRLRGRGLWLMRQLCDEVRIIRRPGGSSVVLRQALHGPPAFPEHPPSTPDDLRT